MIRSVTRPLFCSVIALTSLLFVSGCQTVPKPLIINLPVVQPKLNANVSAVVVTDARSHRYLYRQLNTAEKASFVTSSEPLTEIISHALQAVVDPTTVQPLRWVITIDDAVIEAEISALKYQLTHHIVLRVEAISENRRFTNTYTGHAESESIGRPDAAVVEREFSSLLTQVLRDIINDPQLRLKTRE